MFPKIPIKWMCALCWGWAPCLLLGAGRTVGPWAELWQQAVNGTRLLVTSSGVMMFAQLETAVLPVIHLVSNIPVRKKDKSLMETITFWHQQVKYLIQSSAADCLTCSCSEYRSCRFWCRRTRSSRGTGHRNRLGWLRCSRGAAAARSCWKEPSGTVSTSSGKNHHHFSSWSITDSSDTIQQTF